MVTYQVADGRSLPFDDESFDVVVFDSTLCHVPGSDQAVARHTELRGSAVGWQHSTVITPRRQWRSARLTRCRRASKR